MRRGYTAGVRKGFARRLLGVRDERGSTLVEFAFAFPVLVAVLFGMIDGGRFVSARVALGQATAEAARAACLSSTGSTGAVDTAFTNAAALLPGATIDWTTPGNTTCKNVACGTFPLATGDVVWITGQYNFQAAASFLGPLFSKTLTQKSRMVCE
jgi:Flp pilus assembly protein TadG